MGYAAVDVSGKEIKEGPSTLSANYFLAICVAGGSNIIWKFSHTVKFCLSRYFIVLYGAVDYANQCGRVASQMQNGGRRVKDLTNVAGLCCSANSVDHRYFVTYGFSMLR